MKTCVLHQLTFVLDAYLAEQLQHEAHTVLMALLSEVFHDPVISGHQFLVLLAITTAKLPVHDAELQISFWTEGWLKVQTLGVKRCRCHAQEQHTHNDL